MKRVLILGSKGTLGGQLMKLYPEAAGWDREDIDVLDDASLRAKIGSLGFTPTPSSIAWPSTTWMARKTAPTGPFALNAGFVGELAEYAKGMGIPLVHYSTNYVFDGLQGEYAEADPPAPLSVYGRSKLRGEQLAAASGAWCYVVRTAVIFGPKGVSDLSKKSFVDIMLDLAAKRDTLEVVSDEINSLTYAPDLAAGTHGLLEALPPPGIYHSPTAAAQAGSISPGRSSASREKHDRASRTLVPFPA